MHGSCFQLRDVMTLVRPTLLCRIVALTAMIAAHNATAADKPATVAEAAAVLDLTKFPLVDGSPVPRQSTMAQLSYEATGDVKKVYEFQRKTLVAQKWQESPGAYITDQSASGTFKKQGFAVSASVSPGGKPNTVSVYIINHGNVDVSKLPVPTDAKSQFASPVTAMFVSPTPVDKTTEACRKLLLAQGWQPYGTAGESSIFKQNAVRLNAYISAAPAQGGKTMISYSTEQLSADIPAPGETTGLQYSDSTHQLLFDTNKSPDDMVAFYRAALAKLGWTATLEKLVQVDRRDTMIFRNAPKDMITMVVFPFEDKLRVQLTYETAAELAEQEKRAKAAVAKLLQEKSKPASKLAIAIPADAKEVKLTKSQLEFNLPAGKARAAVETWRKHFQGQGWKEDNALLEAMAGSVSLSKDSQRLNITYIDTGFLPAEIDVTASGVELEQASAAK